ncbi:MAG: FoF1 ATP synthase subunit delta/epsilon [Planctomycetaceae bacterium]
MPDLQLVLVTPETTLLDEPVTALRFPLFDGQVGVLPGRAPLVGRLGYGELKVTAAAGERSYFIDGGFVQVKGSTVSLLTNRAMPTGDVSADEAQSLLDRAGTSAPHTDAEFASRDRDLERARRMLALARRA